MFRKLLSSLLLVCLILPCLSMPAAQADYKTCEYCGQTLFVLPGFIDLNHLQKECPAYYGSDKYDPSYSRNSSSSSLKITSCVTNADGSVTIRWSDSGNNAPYSVHYEFLQSAPKSFWWTDESGLYTKSFTFEWLAPEVDYKLTVQDADGNRATYTYYARYHSTYNEIGTQMDLGLRKKSYSSTQSLSRFSASDIRNASYSTSYGLYIKLEYSMLARARNYHYRFVLYAPNDYAKVFWAGNLSLPSGRSRLSPWDFIDLTDYFDTMERWYGEIAIGTYELVLYYDDTKVLTKTFYVGG